MRRWRHRAFISHNRSFARPRSGCSRAGRHHCGQRRVDHRCDEGRRCVERARARDVGRHHSLEHAAQHVGRDLACRRSGDREVKALEETIECLSPDLVRDVASTRRSSGCGSNRPPFRKGAAPKSSGPTPPLGEGSVECSEEERLEEVPVHTVSSGQATIDLLTL